MSRIVYLLITLLCINCAHKNSYNFGEYYNSPTNDMAFYSQYEIVYKTKKYIIVAAFSPDTNDYLPKDTIKLRLGIQIKNPNDIDFVVWTDCSNGFMHADTPQEFIMIDLPIDADLEVKCTTSIINEGVVLYKTQTQYKTKGNQL